MTEFSYAKHYTDLHEANPKWFSGKLPLDAADDIHQLIRKTKAKRILDYGSGKGYQYLRDRIHERWGGLLPYCYDPGVPNLCSKPSGPFDGIICTDVMEHIAPADIHIVLKDIFSLVSRKGFVYFAIHCHLAGKHFLSGENVHLTVEPPSWWRLQLHQYKRSGLIIMDEYEYVRYNSRDDVQSDGIRGLRS